jgi:hypothetical protein
VSQISNLFAPVENGKLSEQMSGKATIIANLVSRLTTFECNSEKSSGGELHT